MASFPDNLPPEGLDSFYKALIYLGIIYFVLTAFTTWFITRRRPKSPIEYREIKTKSTSRSASSAVTQISFEDSRDMLASLKVEIAGAEASLTQLGHFRDGGEISNNAYTLLHSQYSTEVARFTKKMNEMLKADIVSSTTGEIASGMTDEAMSDIEADLEKQLKDLEKEDDFLRPRTSRRAKTSLAQAPEPMAAKTTITEPKHEKVKVTNPPPPTQAIRPPDKPATPAPTPITETAPPPPSVSAPPPASVPPPSAPTKVPPPPAKPGAAPTPAAPQAAQPMKVESAEPEKEKIFAKSTSIAALRMDMLRELARLKKLINEDE